MRRTPLAAGLALLAALWLGPLPELARGSFAAHMALHMGVLVLGSLLLALAVAGTPADPVRRRPGLLPPLPVSFLELVLVWAWHAPGLHEAARRDPVAFAAEQGSFLAAGLALWLAVLGGSAARRRARAPVAILALLLTAMHMTLLGALLGLAPRPLYGHAVAHGGLGDQQLGGAAMILGGGAAYLAAGLWLVAGMLRAGDPREPA